MLTRRHGLVLSYKLIAAKFWSPFGGGVKGADLSRYRARENMLELVAKPRRAPVAAPAEGAGGGAVEGAGGGQPIPGMPHPQGTNTHSSAGAASPPIHAPVHGGVQGVGALDRGAYLGFSCQVNAIVGDIETVENMFITILTGFDVVKVVLDPAPDNSPSLRGTIFVQHCRPFLGWQPTDTTIFFPFSMFMEGDAERLTLSHLVLHFHFDDALKNAGCPSEVLSALSNGEALRILAALRRARVSPEAITTEALFKAAAEKAEWNRAVGPFE